MLRQLSELYDETAYRGIVHEGVLKGPGNALEAVGVVEAALRDPQILDALILWLERFEMPPVMIGVALGLTFRLQRRDVPPSDWSEPDR